MSNTKHKKSEFTDLIKVINKELFNIEDVMMSEDELINHIANRVKELLDSDIELLMSYLYRLDIPEAQAKVATQITHQVPLHQSMALLIYYRQLERVRTKLKYKQEPLSDEWQL